MIRSYVVNRFLILLSVSMFLYILEFELLVDQSYSHNDMTSHKSRKDSTNGTSRSEAQSAHNGEYFSLGITNDMINRFKVQLPMLPNYKNPCWLERVPTGFTYYNNYFAECLYKKRGLSSKTPKAGIISHFGQMNTTIGGRLKTGNDWRLRCFPYFFLIGVAKSGTTILFRSISQFVHEFSQGALKEHHYWELKRESSRELKNDCGQRRRPTFSDYIDTFDKAAEDIRKTTITKNGKPYHNLFTGEGTPTTLTNDYGWMNHPGNRGMTAPKYTNAHYIHSIRPETKLIVIMREPAQRLFSNLQMKLRLQSEKSYVRYTESMFPRLVRNSINKLQLCMRRLTIRACIYNDTDFDFMHMVFKSLYIVYIKDWMTVFPRNQFLFLTLEEFKKNKIQGIGTVATFLGASSLNEADKAGIRLEDQKLQRKLSKLPPPPQMDNQTKSILRTFFRPFNHQLADLLKNREFTWGY